MAAKGKKQKRPKPPEGLSDEANAEWDRICRELQSVDRLSAVDRAMLTVYVNLWSVMTAARKEVAEKGYSTVYSNGNQGATAAYTVFKETSRQIRTLLNDMGITPVRRENIDIPSAGDGELPNF